MEGWTRGCLIGVAGLLIGLWGCAARPVLEERVAAGPAPRVAEIQGSEAAAASEAAGGGGPEKEPLSVLPEEPVVAPPPAPRETSLAAAAGGGGDAGTSPASLAAPDPATPGAGEAVGAEAQAPLKDVFFDFDEATIREDQQAPLKEAARWLLATPGVRLTIEGYSDERGTSEYNMGLGDRRATAVKAYLMALGVRGERVRVVSYGEERPFVLGHDESAWRWNRRAHLVPER